MEETKIASYQVDTCFICSSKGKSKYTGLDDRNFGTSKSWNISECTNESCGLLWLNPMPTKEDIGKAYESYYTHSNQKKPILDFTFLEKPYLAVSHKYTQGVSAFQKLLGAFAYLLPIIKNNFDFKVLYLDAVKGGKILDFGCGNGWLLDNLKVGGWECYGLDFDPKAVEFCRSKGLNVNLGDIQSQNFPDNYFDAITINHVIEHVHEVDELLKACYQKLKKGGKLVIATPNTENWQHGLYKKYWFQLDPPRHLHLFNIGNMEKVVERNKFTVQKSFSSVRMDAWATAVTKAIKRKGRFVIGTDKKRLPDYLLGLFHQKLSYIYTLFNKKAAGEMIVIATKD